MTNRKFAKEDTAFQKACEVNGVRPTTRQASKYRNGKGAAFKKILVDERSYKLLRK